MNVLFFIIGLLLGLLVMWFYFSSRMSVYHAQMSEEKELRVKYETELKTLLKNQEMLDVSIKESIESYVLNAMKLNNEQFLELSRKVLEKYFLEADKGLENKAVEIEKIIAPLRKSLESYDKKISDFQKYSAENLGGLSQKLAEVSKMQQDLGKQTYSLINALKTPNIRGKWGEIGLRRIVEFAGLNDYCDFSEQVSIGNRRPDMIIYLPEGRKIVVDSKLPLDSFLAAMDTDDTDRREELMKKHLEAFRNNMNILSAKTYWDSFEGAVDFVVMYIQVEPALNAALQQNNSLIEEALKKKIILATPTTFIALLQTISYGWKQYKLSENAEIILAQTKEFYTRISVFTEHFSKVSLNMNRLVDSYNSMQRSWKSRVKPILDRIVDLGIGDSKKQKKDIEDVENRAE